MNSRSVGNLIKSAVRHFAIPSGEASAQSSEPEPPIDAFVLIDASGSMANDDYRPTRLGAAVDAALAFLVNLRTKSPKSRAAIGAFADVGLPIVPLRTIADLTTFEEALRSLVPDGGTNFTAGLELVEHLAGRRKRRPSRQQLLLLSDGRNGSHFDPVEISDRLKGNGFEIHTIGIGGDESAVDSGLLKAIASLDANGNPLYRFILDTTGLIRHFAEIGGLTR